MEGIPSESIQGFGAKAPFGAEHLHLAALEDQPGLEAVARVFPGEDVHPIQDWFEREASIRDPAADCFRVRPLIREKVLRYPAIRSPSRHRELTALATEEAG